MSRLEEKQAVFTSPKSLHILVSSPVLSSLSAQYLLQKTLPSTDLGHEIAGSINALYLFYHFFLHQVCKFAHLTSAQFYEARSMLLCSIALLVSSTYS